MYENMFCPACHNPVDATTGEHAGCFFGNNSSRITGYQTPIIEAELLQIKITATDSVIKATIASRDKWARRLAEIETEEQIKFDSAQEYYDNMVKP